MRPTTAVATIAPASQPQTPQTPRLRTQAGSVVSIDAGNHRERVRERRDELVNEHAGMVRSIATRLKQQLPPSFELDDLIQTGMVALLHAATRYRPQEHDDAPFGPYARKVVRGAILDSVSGRNYIEATAPELPAAEAGEEPAVDEMIDALREYGKVDYAIGYLDQRSQSIIRLYFREGATLDTVSAEIGLSRSQVHELLHAAIARLRMILHVPAAA